MKIIQRGTIFLGTSQTPSANNCFPSLIRLGEGALLASWRTGSQKESADGMIMMSRSVDEGVTWSPPTQPLTDLLPAHGGAPHYAPLWTGDDNRVLTAVLWADGLGPKPLFNPVTEGLLPVRTLLYESRDGGQSWRSIGELDSQPYQSPMSMTDAPFTLPDGALACPYEVNKHYEDTGPWRQASALKISCDNGQSWPGHVEVANDPAGRVYYWDAHHATTSSGRCVVAFWTYDHEQKHDLNIHLSESTDSGRTWKSPWDTGLIGQVAQPLFIPGGKLMLIYVDRFRTRSIRVAISQDNGKSFEDRGVVYQQESNGQDTGNQGGTYLNEMTLWTFGRVHAFIDPLDNIWVVYYAGDERVTGIYWARLEA